MIVCLVVGLLIWVRSENSNASETYKAPLIWEDAFSARLEGVKGDSSNYKQKTEDCSDIPELKLFNEKVLSFSGVVRNSDGTLGIKKVGTSGPVIGITANDEVAISNPRQNDVYYGKRPQRHEAGSGGRSARGLGNLNRMFKSAFKAGRGHRDNKSGAHPRDPSGLEDPPPITLSAAVGGFPGRNMSGFGFGLTAVNDRGSGVISPSAMLIKNQMAASSRPFSPLGHLPLDGAGTGGCPTSTTVLIPPIHHPRLDRHGFNLNVSDDAELCLPEAIGDDNNIGGPGDLVEANFCGHGASTRSSTASELGAYIPEELPSTSRHVKNTGSQVMSEISAENGVLPANYILVVEEDTAIREDAETVERAKLRVKAEAAAKIAADEAERIRVEQEKVEAEETERLRIAEAAAAAEAEAAAASEALLLAMRSEVADEMDNISTDGISLDGLIIGAMDDTTNNNLSEFASNDENGGVSDEDEDEDDDEFDIVKALNNCRGWEVKGEVENQDDQSSDEELPPAPESEASVVLPVMTEWRGETEEGESDAESIDISSLLGRRGKAL